MDRLDLCGCFCLLLSLVAGFLGILNLLLEPLNFLLVLFVDLLALLDGLLIALMTLLQLVEPAALLNDELLQRFELLIGNTCRVARLVKSQ